MNEEELKQAQEICEKYLNNADIFEISFNGDSILLKFVCGDEKSFIEIQIECFQIQHFSITKDWDEEVSEGHFVGETHIKYSDMP